MVDAPMVGTTRQQVSLNGKTEAMTANTAPPDDWAVGVSAHLRALKEFVVAQSAARQPILLIGERGLRQHEIASALHQANNRQPFIEINPRRSGPEEMRKTLFGPNGALEADMAGTVFINEFTRLPNLLQQQVAVLLEEQRWRPHTTRPRLIFSIAEIPASHNPETYLVYELAERLRASSFKLQPLRERSEDIPYLARHLAQNICRRLGKETYELDPATLQALAEYHWPQNIDELEALLESAVTQLPPPRINVELLPPHVRFAALRELPDAGIDLARVIDEFEHTLIATALRQTNNSQTKAARLLGLRIQTLNVKIKRLKEKGVCEAPDCARQASH